MSVLQRIKQRAAAAVRARFGVGGLFWFHRTGTLLEHRLRLRDRYARLDGGARGQVNGLVEEASPVAVRGSAGRVGAGRVGDGGEMKRGEGGTVSAGRLRGASAAANGSPVTGGATAVIEAEPERDGSETEAGAERVARLRVITHATSGAVDSVRLPAPPRVPWRKRAAAAEQLAYFPRWHTDGHPRAWSIPETLNGDLAWVRQLKTLYANPISFPSTLSPEAGLLLHALVRNIRPRVVVETGAFIGVSTIWIAAALRENGDGGVVHTFDDFSPIRSMPWCDAEMPEGRLEFVAQSLTRAEVEDHVVAHQGHSAAGLRGAAEMLRAEGGVQLAFLDADHGVRGVWHDLWAVEPALASGGFVILHDTFPEYCGHEGPRHLLDHVNRYAVGKYEKVDLYLSPINYGLGLLRRVG